VIELSKYILEVLHQDDEFVLYRGRSREGESRTLVLSPVAEYPAPETLKRLEHEYSLREELEPAWAARPIGITQHWNRAVLLLEDPGGVPLDQLLGQPLELAFGLRLAVDVSGVIDRLHERSIIHKDIKPANVLANPEHWPILAERVWYRIATPTRTPIRQASRACGRNARLHGTRADRANESFCRFPERSLFARHYPLRNAHGGTSVHGDQSDGMGALPHCKTASPAQ
jgi:hypothetical protein